MLKIPDKAKKSMGVILFIILLVLSLIYFVASAFIFHTADVKEATYYNPQWFLENSMAHRPTFPFMNLTPQPIENISETYIYQVSGDARNLAWRFYVLDTYVPNVGWVPGSNNPTEYNFTSIPNASYFIVRTNIMPFNYLSNFPLIGLWDNALNMIPCSGFNIYVTSASQLNYSVKLLEPDKILQLSVENYTPGYAGFEYLAYTRDANFTSLALSSSTIEETQNAANSSTELSRFLEMPPDYLSSHPEVENLVDNVALAPNYTVYQQTTYLLGYLFSQFRIKSNISSGDPVASFISGGGGPSIGFVNVTALILRFLGIPTRIVIGFLGGTYDETSGFTSFGIKDVYYWIEVWDSSNGWLPYPAYPMYIQAENFVSWMRFDVEAPRILQGYKSFYENETVNITVVLRGDFEMLNGERMFIYDLNESAVVGSVEITKVADGFYTADFTFRYDNLYLNLGREPLYGRHLIAVSIGSVYAYDEIVLLRFTGIGP